ncbi:MAG: hypothetical protein AB1726_16765 [Planctomycetota bacterium]
MAEREDGAGNPAAGEPDARKEPWFLREPAPEPEWRELLRGESPRAILQQICADESLQIVELCEHRLAEQAFLIHPDRLVARSLARVAYAAALGYGGDPPLAAWLTGCVDQSIAELLSEDIEEERTGVPPEEESLRRYQELIPAEVGIAPELSRLTCIQFNTLPQALRIPFFRIVVTGLSIEQYALRYDRPIDEVVRQLDEATRRLVLLVEDGKLGEEDVW